MDPIVPNPALLHAFTRRSFLATASIAPTGPSSPSPDSFRRPGVQYATPKRQGVCITSSSEGSAPSPASPTNKTLGADKPAAPGYGYVTAPARSMSPQRECAQGSGGIKRTSTSTGSQSLCLFPLRQSAQDKTRSITRCLDGSIAPRLDLAVICPSASAPGEASQVPSSMVISHTIASRSASLLPPAKVRSGGLQASKL